MEAAEAVEVKEVRPRNDENGRPIEPQPFDHLSNIDMDEEGEWTEPRRMPEILDDVHRLFNNWPKRVGSTLFVPSADGRGITWIESPDAMFGWFGSHSKTNPRISRVQGCHGRGEIVAELRRTATEYLAVESLIHEPPLPGHYYCNPAASIEPGNGECLRWLLDRFRPETEIDRDLIQAAFMTVVWGGPGGTRPAFVITADSGRGSGKSRVWMMISELAGGHIELSATDEMAAIDQRLLSPEGMSKRIAVLDNVKSLRFSWAALEGRITSPIISGKRMYVGEAQRPNTLVLFVTLNGISLSTDFAQRSVIIKVAKPTFDPLWEEQTRAYIREHREELIADIVTALRADRQPLEKFSRWNAWERDVLSRLPDPAEAQKVIAERQAVADVESEESGIIEDTFQWKLRELGYDTLRDRVFIPTTLASAWLNIATGEKQTTTGASRRIRQMIGEGTLKRIAEATSKVNGRGFHWIGEQHTTSTVKVCIEQRIAEPGRFGLVSLRVV